MSTWQSVTFGYEFKASIPRFSHKSLQLPFVPRITPKLVSRVCSLWFHPFLKTRIASRIGELNVAKMCRIWWYLVAAYINLYHPPYKCSCCHWDLRSWPLPHIATLPLAELRLIGVSFVASLWRFFMVPREKAFAGWWLNHPFEKCESNWIISPGFGVKITNIWNHPLFCVPLPHPCLIATVICWRPT